MDSPPMSATWNPDELGELFRALNGVAVQTERRTSERHKYPFIQLAASFTGEEIRVEDLSFRPFRCYDLSKSGISLILPNPPDFETAVLTLGKPPNVIYVAIQVVYHKPYDDLGGGYLVGCRFLKKLHGHVFTP